MLVGQTNYEGVGQSGLAQSLHTMAESLTNKAFRKGICASDAN